MIEILRREADGLYVSRIKSRKALAIKAIDEHNSSFNPWHRRMAHASKNVNRKVLNNENYGMKNMLEAGKDHR